MSKDRRNPERPGDDDVDEAWRNAVRDEPPARNDAMILSAARVAAAGARPSLQPRAMRPWWVRWQPLAAAAGVAGLAFAIVQMLPRDPGRRPTPAAEMTESSRDEATTTADAAAPTAGSKIIPPPPPVPDPGGARDPAPTAVDTRATPEADNQRSVETPAPLSQSAYSSPPRVIAPDERAAGRMAESAAPVEPAPRQPAESSAATPAPAEWARRVAALHASGDRAAAADALRLFREEFPDADRYLPAELHPWAASIGTTSTPKNRQE
jgi:hypothetical protein